MDTSHFIHNRLWISPWIKSISNELDITIQVIASRFRGHCDVISNRLRHHQQNVNRASEARGRCVMIGAFVVIFGFDMCKKWNDPRNLVMNCLCAHSGVIFGVCSPRCCATREMITKIILSWPHKQFATGTHTLFYMYSLDSDNTATSKQIHMICLYITECTYSCLLMTEREIRSSTIDGQVVYP